MDWRPSTETCPLHHRLSELSLGVAVTIGLVLSYLPQHYRIIKTGSSDGLSPFFLLLGGASSQASLFCLILLQWRVIRCCQVWPVLQSLESLVGVMQVGIQCLMFSIIVFLFIFYYPQNLRYATVLGHQESVDGEREEADQTTPLLGKKKRTRQYSLAWSTIWAVVLHFVLVISLSILFLVGADSPPRVIPDKPSISPIPLPPAPSSELATQRTFDTNDNRILMHWTGFLGLWAAILGSFQYLPQIFTTVQKGSIGALSIPTMAIQCPGSFVFVASLATRPGVDWTGWITYAVTGVLQGILLVICIYLRRKELRESHVDFDHTNQSIGHPTTSSAPLPGPTLSTHSPGERARIVL